MYGPSLDLRLVREAKLKFSQFDNYNYRNRARHRFQRICDSDCSTESERPRSKGGRQAVSNRKTIEFDHFGRTQLVARTEQPNHSARAPNSGGKQMKIWHANLNYSANLHRDLIRPLAFNLVARHSWLLHGPVPFARPKWLPSQAVRSSASLRRS